MSIHGSKTKDIPIFSYRLEGSISDEVGEDRMKWSNTHVLSTLIGTFKINVLRRPKLRQLIDIERFGNCIYFGPIEITYERPDFATYMTDDAEALDGRLKNRG